MGQHFKYSISRFYAHICRQYYYFSAEMVEETALYYRVYKYNKNCTFDYLWSIVCHPKHNEERDLD